MSNKIYTRANDFDRIVGRLQTENVINYGVGDSILDIGCGVGEYTPLFLYKFKRVVGLDPSATYLKEARQAKWRIEYIQGWGETFKLKEKFDTISMNNILEHVDNPQRLLKNCKKHLNPGGRIIVQVPNKESITRRLGVLMGTIDNLDNMTEKEINFYGHKRTYSLTTLRYECVDAGLSIYDYGGVLYKPLPNDDLWQIYKREGEKFVKALVEFGKERKDECACVYCVCG